MDRFKFRMWSSHAGRYFDETNDAMLENVFECMKQQICYDCQNPVFRKIYDRIAYNHIADGMVFEQCTGLKDKNGKLIYEGDILEDDNTKSDQGVVFFDEKSARFLVGMYRYNQEKLIRRNVRVVGNIHEGVKDE